MRPTAPASLATLALLWLALAAAGCTAPFDRGVRRDAASGLYDRAQIAYQLDASRLSLPLTLTHVEGQLVSYDHAASNPTPGQSTATLELIYPHPSGRPGMALARVEIESQLSATESSTGGGGTVRETWELDITRTEVDRAISRLNSTGYFDASVKRGAGVSVTSKLDGTSQEKDWEASPELDQLMVRVRGQGQLVGLDRPAGYRPHGSPPESVVAWRELEARRLASTRVTPHERERELGHLLPPAIHHGLAEPSAASGTQISRLPRTDPGRF